MKFRFFAFSIGCLLLSHAQAQDTTALSGKSLSIKQTTIDTVLLSVKSRLNTSVLTLVAPQVSTQNPYMSLGAMSSSPTELPPRFSIGGNWMYNSSIINASRAKLLLYGTDSSTNVGMGVSANRGLEFYRGATPGFYFNGTTTVAMGANRTNTTITDSSVTVGVGWTTDRTTLPFLYAAGPAYHGTGNASMAKVRIYGTTASDIIGFGVSYDGTGLEYFSGLTNMHTFYGNMTVNDNIKAENLNIGSITNTGKLFGLDSMYLGGANVTYDVVAANYIALGKKKIGQMSNPATIELGNSYSNEFNKPTKAKLKLYGSTDVDVIGLGITGSGLEIFTGSPGKVILHGPMQYDVNRAATFTARTLVDKGYVDSVKGMSINQWTGANSPTDVLTRTGNVGIGSNASANPDDKLVVNGNIKAKRVIITLTGWGDYVFDSTYQLMPLRHVADYIQTYRHLPGMPTARQIENNGADMGNLVKKQQVKIEELTLYIIDQEKKNQSQQQALAQQLEEQRKMIEALQEELHTIKR